MEHIQYSHPMVKGPFSTRIKNDHEIIITGSNKKDLNLLIGSWKQSAFGAGVKKVHVCEEPNPSVMLSGKIKKNLTENEKLYLERNYGVKQITHKFGTRYDIIFQSSELRNSALVNNYIMAGGFAIMVEEWKRSISLSQCYNCYKFNHHGDACKGKKTCRYCGQIEMHESKQCKEINNIDNHWCSNCKARGHDAGDKINCRSYQREYHNLCQRLGVDAKQTNYISNNNSINKQVEEAQANQLLMNKWIVAEGAKNPAKLTLVASAIYSPAVINLYQKKKEDIHNQQVRENVNQAD